MTIRNLSPQAMFEELACATSLPAVLIQRKRVLRPEKKTPFRKLWPPWVISRQKLNSTRNCWLNGKRMACANSAGSLMSAAILCCHGHGLHGKMPVMGDESSTGKREAVRMHNYNYGYQMAKAGARQGCDGRVPRAGLEPTTCGLGIRRSVQLSYRSIFLHTLEYIESGR